MFTVEEIGTDARSADGYVALFKFATPNMTGVLAVPFKPPKSTSLRKLRRMIEKHPDLSVQLEGFDIESRTVGRSFRPNVFEIKFAVKAGMEGDTIPLFLQIMLQCGVITNPIVSDVRSYKRK